MRYHYDAVLWTLSACSMTLGGLIYLAWRPVSLRMFTWFESLRLGDCVEQFRCWAQPHQSAYPDWVCMSLPQGLWVLSGCLAMQAIWVGSTQTERWSWCAIVVLLGFFGELGQLTGIVPGTFDAIDLVLVVAAFLVSLVIGRVRSALNPKLGG